MSAATDYYISPPPPSAFILNFTLNFSALAHHQSILILFQNRSPKNFEESATRLYYVKIIINKYMHFNTNLKACTSIRSVKSCSSTKASKTFILKSFLQIYIKIHTLHMNTNRSDEIAQTILLT